MNFEPSTYFFEVMRWKSISKAAHQLGISQPALSRYLKGLEKKIGKKLYRYGNKTITLTPDGQEFASFLKDRLALEKSFFNRICKKPDEPQGKVVLLASSQVANGWLMKYVGAYLKKHPHVRITVLTADKDIRWTPEVDMVIAPQMRREEIESIYLTQSKIKLFAGKEYLERFGMPQTLSDLTKHRFIALSKEASETIPDINFLLKRSDADTFLGEAFLEVGSLTALKLAAENNIGIIAWGQDERDNPSFQLIEILPGFSPLKVELYLSYLKKYKDQEPLKSLRLFLEKEIKNSFRI